MKKIIKSAIVVLMYAATFDAVAQDPVFSQFYNSPVYLNPALIGDEENIALNLSYRSQWHSIHKPYSTTQASMIFPFYQSIDKYPQSHIGGVGISLYSDVAETFGNHQLYGSGGPDEMGTFNSYQRYGLGGSASFAYNLQLGMRDVNRITFALQVGFINKRLTLDHQRWGSQNPVTGSGSGEVAPEGDLIDSKTMFDITPGVFWRYFNSNRSDLIQSVYSGFSVGHINNPNQSVFAGERDRMPTMYTYHGGVIFGLSHRASISANILSKLQDMENQTNVGAFLSYRLSEMMEQGMLSNVIGKIGGWYRRNDSFILFTGIATDNLEAGFSYDWNVTNLNRFEAGLGAYEISLKLSLSRFAPPKVTY